MAPATSGEDQTMADVSSQNPATHNRGGEISSNHPVDLYNDNRIHVLPGASDESASFEFENEDHTLGNSLRYIINKNPEVELCGYSIPHPSEAKMNLRIQTYEGTTVYEALEKGFNDLMELCNVVIDKFTVSRDAFDKERSL